MIPSKIRNNLIFRKIMMIAAIIGVLVLAVSYNEFKTNIAQAAINKQINYQGKLTDKNNVAVADGSYNFKFRLCAASDCGGGGDPIWTETREDANKVTATSGLFSIMLGEVNSLSSVDFNQTLYLEVQIGGTSTPSYETLLPRKKLGAVPAAFTADLLDGLDSSLFVRNDTTNTISASSTDTLMILNHPGIGAVLSLNGSTTAGSAVSLTQNGAAAALTVTQDGSGQIVNIKDGNNTVFSIADGGDITFGNSGMLFDYSTGYLGIGTTSPLASLDIYGNLIISGSDRYLNFGAVVGVNGYGFRDNSGNLEFKNSSGDWAVFGAGNGSGTLNYGLTGSIAYYPSAGTTATGTAPSLLVWDNTNGRLGIGTSSPMGALSIKSVGTQLVLAYDDAHYSTITTNSAGALVISSPAIMAMIGNDGLGGDVYIGDVGSASNLVFEESSTIMASGTNSLTIGQSGNIINLNVAGATYNLKLKDDSLVYFGTGNNASLGWSTSPSTNALTFAGFTRFATTSNSVINPTSIANPSAGDLFVQDDFEVGGDAFIAGNLTATGTVKFNGLSYTFPSSQTAGYLRTDGNGSLTWSGSTAGYGLAKSLSYYSSTGNAATGTTNALLAWDDTNGYLGIGSSTPSARLTVAGTSSLENVYPEANLTYDLGSSAMRWNQAWISTLNLGTSTWSMTQGADGRLSIFDSASGGGTERMTILSNGNIGIGSTSPAYNFSVNGNTNISGDLAISGSVTGGVSISGNITSATWHGNTIGADYGGTGSTTLSGILKGNGTGAVQTAIAGTDYVVPSASSLTSLTTIGSSLTGILKASSGSLSAAAAGTDYLAPTLTTGYVFSGNSSNIAQATSSLYISSASYVGIGTSSPLTTLDTYGNLALSGSSRYLNFGATSTTSSIGANGYGIRDNSGTLEIKNSSGSWTAIGAGGSGTVNSGTANQISFYNSSGTAVSGTSTIMILPSGNIGIGTTSPAAKLHVIGSIALSAGADSSLASYDAYNLNIYGAAQAGTAGKGVVINYYYSGWKKALEILNTSSAYGNLSLMQDGGNVGIGTTTPQAKLSIVGSTNGAVAVNLENLNAGSSANSSLNLTSDGGTSYLYRTSVAYTAGYGDNTILQDAGGGDILIWGGSEIARFKNSGNVGIGTSSPLTKLDVYGNLALSGSSRYLNFGATTTTSSIGANGYGLYDNSGTLQFRNSSGSWINLAQVNSGTANQIAFYNSSGTVVSGTSTITILSSGYVGISTTTPNYNLVINGTTNNFLQIASSTNQGIFVVNSAGYIGIGTNNPLSLLHTKNGVINVESATSTFPAYTASTTPGEVHGLYTGGASNTGFLRLSAGGDATANVKAGIDIGGYTTGDPSLGYGSVVIWGGNATAGAPREIARFMNGKVGIGRNDPATVLDVAISDANTLIGQSQNQLGLRIRNTNSTASNMGGIGFTGTANNIASAIYGQITDHANDYSQLLFVTGGSGGFATRMTIDSTGNITVPGWYYGKIRLTDVWCGGSWTTQSCDNGSNGWVDYADALVSDARLKTIVAPLSSGVVNKLRNIDSVYYQWNDTYKALGLPIHGPQEIGVIAQNVQEQFPELVYKEGPNDPYFHMDYQKFTAVLLQGIKELDQRTLGINSLASATSTPTPTMVIDENGNVKFTSPQPSPMLGEGASSTPAVAVVDIESSSASSSLPALAVNQNGTGDIADLRANNVSVMNISNSGRVTIVGELFVDGRGLVCSGGACPPELDASVKQSNADFGVEGSVVAGAYEGYCDPGWVWVAGNAKYGTMPGFCVMARGARENTILHKLETDLTQINNSLPWTSISQGDAQQACQAAGSGYHLISENEWLTIAENVISTSTNDIDPETAGLQLATTKEQLATTSVYYRLADGDYLYELAGEAGEWTQGIANLDDLPTTAASSSIGEWQEYKDIASYKALGSIRPPYYYDSTNGIGRILIGSGSDPVRGFIRGTSGIYGLNLSQPPTLMSSEIGFRCAK